MTRFVCWRIDYRRKRWDISAVELPIPNYPDMLEAVQVLLVEDSQGDVRLTRDSLRRSNPTARLHVARDGTEAMAFLRREGRHVTAPRPSLILLDLNLPKMDGREVLAQIKTDVNLKTIPTVIFTTSDADADVEKSYELQANSYFTKPVELDDFEQLISTINEFWLKAKWPKRA